MICVEVWDRTRNVYRKISMRKELVQTKLETQKVCPCNYDFSTSPVGKEYLADLGTIRTANMKCGGCKASRSIPVINVLNEETSEFYPFALNALEIRHQVRIPNVTIN